MCVFLYRTPPKGCLSLLKTRFRSDKNVTDAKLENTSLSTDVFMTVFMQGQPTLRRLVIECSHKIVQDVLSRIPSFLRRISREHELLHLVDHALPEIEGPRHAAAVGEQQIFPVHAAFQIAERLMRALHAARHARA